MKRKNICAVCLALCVLVLSGCGNAMKEGTEQLEKKDYSGAVESFAEVIKEGKNVGEAYHGQGIAYWELQEYESAGKLWRKHWKTESQERRIYTRLLEMPAWHWESTKKPFLLIGKEWDVTD